MLSDVSTNLLTAGVDEVGRGPLAGPVYTAAVILPAQYELPGLTDSKKLSALKRNRLAQEIKTQAVSYAYGWATVEEIDAINILQASLLAMQRAVKNLSIVPQQVLVDGSMCPQFDMPAKAIVKGDLVEPCISAASILAKVARDDLMTQLDAQYPGYGFAQHAGYPTQKHMQALQQLGPCAIHRLSFKPVAKCAKVS